MRAIQISEFGGPEALRLVELPTPEPAAGEALVRVTRAGVNFADTHQRTNSYVRKATLPLVPGGEVAGVVTAVGGRESAEGIVAGAALTGLPDGVRVGQRVVALTGDGGYAEYATAPVERCYPVPEGLDDDTAVALLIQGLTAWHLYRTAGRVAQGESVVVHSAAGGVGSLAVQLGHPLGAGRVIGTASSPERREVALSLGADVAIDSDPEGLTERLIEANGGREVDVVFDMAGGEAFERSYAALAHFGRIVVCGISSQQPNEVRTGSLLRHSRTVTGFYLFHCLPARPRPPGRALQGAPGRVERPEMVSGALADLFARAVRGELRVVIGGVYPLPDAAQAQIDLRSRRTSGKLLLDPGPPSGVAPDAPGAERHSPGSADAASDAAAGPPGSASGSGPAGASA